jgi:3-deoxy-manno-octulosonate cytidylyltransferase (CMP-KDO synthetase)
MRVLAVIPARFDSSRLPGKVLAKIGNKSMIEHVFDQAKKSSQINQIVIATDNTEVEAEAISFGAEVFVSVSDHDTGTSRCLEAARNFEFDILINIQGDEPFISPEVIDELITTLSNSEAMIATVISPIKNQEDLFNPNVVKAVINDHHDALLFSRQAIPYLRDEAKENWIQKHTFYKHQGIYAFKEEGLSTINYMHPSILEKAESLEQLRWLDNGMGIKCMITETDSVGIDTAEDLETARRRF